MKPTIFHVEGIVTKHIKGGAGDSVEEEIFNVEPDRLDEADLSTILNSLVDRKVAIQITLL